tara:strand:- start:4942 stop:5328 length:387 start_codon:yes stop_codon:yes gene_type:complete
MTKKLITTASILGAIAIILGAFGAHALKKVLNSDQLITFETGVRYQMYHALFLLFISTLDTITDKSKKVILTLIQLGVLFFSGSIYLLASNDLTAFDFKTIGFITPIGGALLIAAWCVLIYQNWMKKL